MLYIFIKIPITVILFIVTMQNSTKYGFRTSRFLYSTCLNFYENHLQSILCPLTKKKKNEKEKLKRQTEIYMKL